jgi:transcriptional regulator with XRE-family HTH domain
MFEVALVRRDRSGWTEDEILGDELRIARECLNLTQEELGRRIFLSRKQVMFVEAGRKELTRKEFRDWAEAVGRSVESFDSIVKREVEKQIRSHRNEASSVPGLRDVSAG